MRVLPGIIIVLSALGFAALFGVRVVDRIANATRVADPAPGTRAVEIHASLRVVDLHSDALVWNRSLIERSSRGHVDLPRLRAGGFVLQVFSTPNSYPLGANYRRTPAGPDLMDVLAVGNHWPSAAWTSPVERVLVQAARLQQAVDQSDGSLVLVLDRDDLRALLEPPAHPVGAVLATEGLYGLDGDAGVVDRLYAAGFRIFAPVHMTDSEIAGSAHGWNKGGLTAFGRRVVARIDSLGGIIDLAHASPATITDVLAMRVQSPLVSHTGVDGTCPGNRNLSDEELAGIAAAGGLVGIGFWRGAVCGDDAVAIARAIRHAADVAGPGHVALGSDFDGSVRTPFDAAGIARLTAALLEAGFDEDAVRAIMGGNALAFFARRLPEGS